MSSDDSPLEGGDPRVLQKSGETVYTTTDPARSGPRYHATKSCRRLDVANNVVERDRAIAEWQGCEPCAVCHDNVSNGAESPLTADDVDAAREAVLTGSTTGDVATELGVSSATIQTAITDASRGRSAAIHYDHSAREWVVEVDR